MGVLLNIKRLLLTVVGTHRMFLFKMMKKPDDKMTLGTLEEQVMQILWQEGPLSVREVNAELKERKLAHTTVMTTLDRLFKKGLLRRSKEGLAYIYRPAMTREAYHQRLVDATVAGLMSKLKDARPVLAAFVDAAGALDEENLTSLEALIAEKRRGGE